MMTTEVIILAQGQQTRLPGLLVPKQWLSLSGCHGTPILHRTLVQVLTLNADILTVVAGPALAHLAKTIKVPSGIPPASFYPVGEFRPAFWELPDPGNSSLKGARRALDQVRVDISDKPRPPADRTVILLGDVVYSWRCLDLLMAPERSAVSGDPIVVAGTSDLSPSGGELWGISWPASSDAWVSEHLDKALEKHPPFKEYQCGQLRRWHWAMSHAIELIADPYAKPYYRFERVDDYTDDVDVPADVDSLPATSIEAALDDATRGITWPL